MILPDYQIEVVSTSSTRVFYKLHFDKVVIKLLGEAKHNRLEIHLYLKDGVSYGDVNLLKYIGKVADFLDSNSYVCEQDKKYIDLFNKDIVKSLIIRGFEISSGDVEIIKYKFSSLISLFTENCFINKKANMGLLSCWYIDMESKIESMDSFNYFSGRKATFKDSIIIENNSRVIHLNSVILKFERVDMDYESFILTLDAPNLRELNIEKKNNERLDDKDLIFISGLYNLEKVYLCAMLSSLDQIKKLERLREVRGIFLRDSHDLKMMKDKRKAVYNQIQNAGASESELKDYLMCQLLFQYNDYLELLNKLYVDRLQRVKWGDKIRVNDVERIRLELIEISKMFYTEKRKIAREVRQITIDDTFEGLIYKGEYIKKRDEVSLVNSSLFGNDGIDYYVLNKEIIK